MPYERALAQDPNRFHVRQFIAGNRRSASVLPVSDVQPEIIATSLMRLVDRLRSASESRLTRPHDQLAGQSLVEAAYELARWCVAQYQQLTATDVPALLAVGPFAAGDQLFVVGRDLVTLIKGGDAPTAVGEEFLRRIDAIRSVS